MPRMRRGPNAITRGSFHAMRRQAVSPATIQVGKQHASGMYIYVQMRSAFAFRSSVTMNCHVVGPVNGRSGPPSSEHEGPEQAGQRRRGKDDEKQAAQQDVAPQVVHDDMASDNGGGEQEPPVQQ